MISTCKYVLIYKDHFSACSLNLFLLIQQRAYNVFSFQIHYTCQVLKNDSFSGSVNTSRAFYEIDITQFKGCTRVLRIGDFSTRFWSSQQVADTKYIEDVIGFQFKSIRMTIKIRKKLKIVCKISYDKSPILVNIQKILFK